VEAEHGHVLQVTREVDVAVLRPRTEQRTGASVRMQLLRRKAKVGQALLRGHVVENLVRQEHLHGGIIGQLDMVGHRS